MLQTQSEIIHIAQEYKEEHDVHHIMSSTISGERRAVAYTAAQYTYLSMASVMYIIRIVLRP